MHISAGGNCLVTEGRTSECKENGVGGGGGAEKGTKRAENKRKTGFENGNVL